MEAAFGITGLIAAPIIYAYYKEELRAKGAGLIGDDLVAIGWSDLTFTPNEDAIERLAEAWAWLLKEPFQPVLFSTIGDMFFEPDSGGIWWLNTGTGELTRVADTLDQFRELLRHRHRR